MRVGVSGCFNGAKVSHRPKATINANPGTRVPMTLGSEDFRVVVYTIPVRMRVVEIRNRSAPT